MTIDAFYYREGEHGEELRGRLLADQLVHVEANIDRYAVAGPLKQDGATVGYLLVIKVEDDAAARKVFKADPFFRARLWQAIRADQFTGIAGGWVRGDAWKN